MLRVQVGDVVLTRAGLARVVRKVSRFPDGELRALTFAIKRCSWTHRPYTVLNYQDLRWNGYRPTGLNVTLDRQEDLRLQAEIKDYNRQKMDCCEGKDLP